MDNFFVAHAYWVLLFPFIAFLVNGLYLGRRNPGAAGWLAVGLSALSLTFTLNIAIHFYRAVLLHPEAFPLRTLIACETDWLSFVPVAGGRPGLTAAMGIYLDPISVMMLVVITVVSLLVNIYSMGYMAGDPGFGRFFSYLPLFSFSMLGLVAATNLFQMYVFWELVGVSSYLLIGFWYQKPSAVAACKKAFIVTRFADAFFLLGIILVSYFTKSFDFLDLNSDHSAALLNRHITVGFASFNLLTLATVLIFAGGWGKSAMFPLHVWLPDAMEGPTPVSSIIHSATMVVAGVYLTARMFPLFASAPHTLEIVAFIGAFTSLFAAVIACTQTDIKRILAFSTLSQLGYMMFSLGTAKLGEGAVNGLGFSASMFHVFTHAFFKCLLFLSAGAVIHVVHSNEISDMGGLKKHLPITYWATLIACLAIGGIFPFSGFFSKDEILLTAFQNGHYLTFAVGFLTGGLTAFYMFRFFFLIFHGTSKHHVHGHENRYMTFSIAVLALPSLCIGWLSKDFFGNYLAPSIEVGEHHFLHPAWLPYAATGMGLLGLGLAWIFYGRGASSPADSLRQALGPAYLLIQRKFYIDELYLFVTRRVIFACVAQPARWFDRTIVDGVMNLVGFFCRLGGSIIQIAQNGQVQFYLGVMIAGLYLLHRYL